METLAPTSLQLPSLPRPAKRRRLAAPGDAAPALELVPDSLNCCPHPGFVRGVCISCGNSENDGVKRAASDGDDEGVGLVPFEYIHEGLALSRHVLDALRVDFGADLMERRKLVLILDLDHTLLHSRKYDQTEENQSLILQPPSDDDLFMDSGMITKLRPYARHLLTALEPLFDMYIYTKGSRPYASRMAKLLDPEGRLFQYKVISREDSTEAGTKALDVVIAPSEAVVIVDDNELVWRRRTDRDRLINVKEYRYSGFCGSEYDCGAARKGNEDEDDDPTLLHVFDALSKIHSEFFSSTDGSHGGRDVKKIMRSIRRDILCSCRIAIDDAFTAVDKKSICNISKRLGATSLMELDEEITHIVARDRETEAAKWATANGKFLVSIEWLEEAWFTWMMPREADFPPPPSSEQEG